MYLFICLTERRIIQLFIVMFTNEIEFLMWSLDSSQKKKNTLSSKGAFICAKFKSFKAIVTKNYHQYSAFKFFGRPPIPLQFHNLSVQLIFAHSQTYFNAGAFVKDFFLSSDHKSKFSYEIHIPTLAYDRG